MHVINLMAYFFVCVCVCVFVRKRGLGVGVGGERGVVIILLIVLQLYVNMLSAPATMATFMTFGKSSEAHSLPFFQTKNRNNEGRGGAIFITSKVITWFLKTMET